MSRHYFDPFLRNGTDLRSFSPDYGSISTNSHQEYLWTMTRETRFRRTEPLWLIVTVRGPAPGCELNDVRLKFR